MLSSILEWTNFQAALASLGLAVFFVVMLAAAMSSYGEYGDDE